MPEDKPTTALPEKAGAPAIPGTILILPLPDVIIFPAMIAPLYLEDKTSIQIVDEASSKDRFLGTLAVHTKSNAFPAPDELYRVGTVCRILKLMKNPDGTQTILVQGIKRFFVREWQTAEQRLVAAIDLLEDRGESDKELAAMSVNVKQLAQRMVELDPQIPKEVGVLLANIQDVSMLCDVVTSGLNIPLDQKQGILETLDVKERYKKVTPLLTQQMEILELGSKIQSQVKDSIDKNQQKYLLREQMKAIQKELGEGDEHSVEMEALKKKILEAKMPPEVEKEARHELERLAMMPTAAPEHSMIKTYIDWLVEVPWSKQTVDRLDIKRAQVILDEDHYGLEKVKKRIVEYLAVRKMKNDMHGPILCFVGPPGVGKTSLGRSIARALERTFVRISLGGVRDEAEIRGHRRTYIGALPGRIIQGLKKAGSNNPVFMLDEVDKLGNDFRGDPASALLEVLDPEQNNSFSDHYLNVPFDLSKVMFITTANMLDSVPPALHDRMEIMEFYGYTAEEKLAIAQRYLVTRQLKEHGVKPEQLCIEDSALKLLIASYTKEAGLRNLEREIATIVRGVARILAENGKIRKCIRVGAKDIVKYLGPVKFEPEVKERTARCGVATGLAWTAVGGDILFVEATKMPGKGGLMLTGHLGEVMKESAQAAMSYLRANARDFRIDQKMFSEQDFHVHVPAGAIPKDGPSAGVTMLSALSSLLLNRPVKNTVAMTGEITLRGAVLPIGGLKEKVLAAKQAGIFTVIVPTRNKKDIIDLPASVRKDMTFDYVSDMRQAVRLALEDGKR
jgi:ATP-dependent Lon protease